MKKILCFESIHIFVVDTLPPLICLYLFYFFINEVNQFFRNWLCCNIEVNEIDA